MNNTLYWALGIIGAILLFLLVWFMWPGSSPVPLAPNTTPNNGFPLDSGYVPYANGNSSTSSSTEKTMEVSVQGGRTITVKDFINNGETEKDVVNPGYYILAGDAGYCLANGHCVGGAKTSEFFITYSQAAKGFNIVLSEEPLGKARGDAEQFLMSRLGVDPVLMCALVYYVSVPSSINPIYAGKNLGWSFCPGASQL